MKKQLLLLFLSFLCSNTASIQANPKTQTIDVATIDLSACDADGNNAFHAAARAGDLATMKKLLLKQDEADGWYQSLSWCFWGSRAYPVNLQNNNGDTALHCAIENNHPEMVKLLLTQGKAKIDQKIANNKKSTPLWLATEKGDDQSVTILIAHDNNYHTETLNGKNVLHAAITNNKPALVAIYSLNKKLLNEKDSDGNTPLLRAVNEKLTSSTRILLQNGADTSIPSKRGLPALHESIHAGNITTTQLLLESGYSIDSTDATGKTALRHAVDLNAQDTINFLLRCKANPNKPDYMGNTPAHSAAANNNISTLSALKSYNANMNVQNKNEETIAHTAAHNGSAAVMHYLLENHKRLIRIANNKGNLPLHTAIDSKKITIARILLAENDPSINAYNNAGNTPLHSAVESKQLDFVILLCSRQADFRYNKKGYSPLHTAAAIGFMDGIKTLKEYGARITDVTGDNNSPLHIAFINNHFNCTHLLIDRTVACMRNNKGRTPLHIIASKKNADTAIIDLLMNYPLDINSPDKKGYTPFAHAARKGNLAMMRKLRYYNAALFTRDKQNNTYLHLAAASGDLQTVEYLKSMGLSLRDKNNNNETPFISAVVGGKSNIINALCIEDFYRDGTIEMGIRKARINGHYFMASDLEKKIEQLKKDCEALKTLQTDIEKLVNANLNNFFALKQKTSINYKELYYDYTPTPCECNQLTLMTTNDIYKKSTAEQRAILKQQLIARQRQEEQHKRILEQRMLSVRQSEERKLYADAVKR